MRPGIGRVVAVAAIVAVVALAYGVLLTRFAVLERPAEQSFGAAAREARIGVYIQPIVIDAVEKVTGIQGNSVGSGARQ